MGSGLLTLPDSSQLNNDSTFKIPVQIMDRVFLYVKAKKPAIASFPVEHEYRQLAHWPLQVMETPPCYSSCHQDKP